MTERRIRMLFMPRERFPTYRIDVDVLFGRELLQRGHAIDFVMQAESEDVPRGVHSWNGRTVWVGPTDTRGGLLHRLRRHGLAVLHDLRAMWLVSPARYDALQVKDKLLVTAIGAVWARMRGVQFFYWLSFPVPESLLLRARNRTARYPRLTLLRGLGSRWLLYRWILPRADHVFVQSQRMKEDICGRGIDAAKVTPVPMGIDLHDFAGRRALLRPRDSSSRVILGYVGTLDAERRLQILVEMLGELISRGMNAKLLLVGDADIAADREALEAHARRLGVSHSIEITGFLPRAQALDRLLEADIGLSPIHPSPILLCGSPTKLIEYLALGLPVVANDHPEQRYVLRHSRAGVRVPWSARQFARAVAWLMRLPAERRAEMGARGRAWVEANRSYGHIADELEQSYLRLLASKPDDGSLTLPDPGPACSKPPRT